MSTGGCARRVSWPWVAPTVHETGLVSPKFVINFPTKEHWRDDSMLIDIVDGMEILMNIVHYYDIRYISIPALGCGLGGLDWKQVKPFLLRSIRGHDHYSDDVKVTIFEPWKK